jgi:hypothetical protein
MRREKPHTSGGLMLEAGGWIRPQISLNRHAGGNWKQFEIAVRFAIFAKWLN